MEEKSFMDADDVSEVIGRSKTYSYKLIKQLNDELNALGYLTVTGRVSTEFFKKKMCYSENKEGR